jgi:hypothetical protein
MVALAGMTPKWGKTQVFFIFAVLGDQFNLQKAMLALWFPRCPIRKSIADTTGSICKSYSTMGNMELDDSENSIPLVIWLAYHFYHRTPLLVHENVRGSGSRGRVWSLPSEMWSQRHWHPSRKATEVVRPKNMIILYWFSLIYIYVYIYVYIYGFQWFCLIYGDMFLFQKLVSTQFRKAGLQ